MVELDRTTVSSLPEALSREWLETNGLGGYASGTVAGAHTRRYHALLVAATQPPVGRRVIFSKLNERLSCGGEEHELGCNLYPGAVQPAGYQYLDGFRLDPWPILTYHAGGAVLEKQVLMRHGHDTTLLGYRLVEAPGPCTLHARLFVAARNHHYLQQARADFDTRLRFNGHQLRMQPSPDGPPVWVWFGEGDFWADGIWYYNLRYPREQERGLDASEDLYSPGELSWSLLPGKQVWVAISTQEMAEVNPQEWADEERQRREQLVVAVPAKDASRRQLFLAADQFLVRRGDGGSVIAGYPWFADWGRDAMIALPGLTLLADRPDDCGRVLTSFVERMDQGLIPNTFGEETGSPGYNTADATLWMCVACWSYLERTGDLAFVKEHLYEPLCDSIDWHRRGTHFGIRADSDGLLIAGDPDTQLTWMDARVDNAPVTPRHGKPVEINGLWYSALRICQQLAERLGEAPRAEECRQLADLAAESFTAEFWSEELGYLYDCVRPGEKDASLRPNQVIALSLPHPLLTPEQMRSVLLHVDELLLTPYGLRTLAPGSPGYCGRYEGDPHSRDHAYHQGTVWPWLIGPYLRLVLRCSDDPAATLKWARKQFAPLLTLASNGLGSVAEVFDGDPPHRPGGCPFQAWSVAAALELLDGD